MKITEIINMDGDLHNLKSEIADEMVKCDDIGNRELREFHASKIMFMVLKWVVDHNDEIEIG